IYGTPEEPYQNSPVISEVIEWTNSPMALEDFLEDFVPHFEPDDIFSQLSDKDLRHKTLADDLLTLFREQYDKMEDEK
ncbi:1288_t:CDS:1, partial [Ambispora leptoticha]